MPKHLKRTLVPKFWRLPRKALKWAIVPRPGPHRRRECIPLQVLVRDVLRLVETGKEAKSMIKARNVLVDGKVRRDPKYPVGIFDVVSIPKVRKNYRIVPCARGLEVIPIPKKEADLKIFRVEGKTWIKGKKLQLNLSGGKSLLVKKDVYKTNDSLVIQLSKNKIVNHFPMKEGNIALIVKGKHRGKLVKIKKLVPGKFRQPPRLLGMVEKVSVDVLQDHAIVVGKAKPALKVM